MYFCNSKIEFMTKTYVIPASKSISNRLLVLQYLYPNLQLKNLSTSQDTVVLQKALQLIKSSGDNVNINIGHAGTAMRFLTALLATIEHKTFLLDGSDRMRQRPIGILVQALQNLGADISYTCQENYPPLKIKGKKKLLSVVRLKANVSSQYISALLLIGAQLPNGLQIHLDGKQVSKPYIHMTLDLLKKLGISIEQTADTIKILPKKSIEKNKIVIEGDWSSASYFYGAMSVLNKPEIILENFHQNSLQGDRRIADYFEKMGVQTRFLASGKIHLSKISDFQLPEYLQFDLLETPDLAQTLATTCLALGIKCKLTGLQTLRIKETDRLAALQNEMQKLGATIKISEYSFELTKPNITHTKVSIKTYDDHRMAMSFAILQKKFPDIQIKDKNVVVKSFPNFWELFETL